MSARRLCIGLEAAPQLAAGLFAAATGFSANAAVFVHLRMARTLLPAGLAGRSTRFYRMAQQRPLGFSAAAQQQAGRRGADVGAILVETNTADQLRHHLFGQAGIGTNRTGGGALIERLHYLRQACLLYLTLLRMRTQHLQHQVVSLRCGLIHVVLLFYH